MQTFLLSNTIYGLNPLRIKERRLYIFLNQFTKDIIFNGHFVLLFDTKTSLDRKEFHNEIDLKRRVEKTTGLKKVLNRPKCSEKSQKSKKIPLNKFLI